jgi:hypothetical protein
MWLTSTSNRASPPSIEPSAASKVAAAVDFGKWVIARLKATSTPRST